MRRRFAYVYTVANALEPMGGGLLSTKRDAVVGARLKRQQAKCDVWLWRKEVREGTEWNVCKVFKWSVVEREHGEEPKKQETLNMGQPSYDCEIMSSAMQGVVVLRGWSRACCYDCHEAGFVEVVAKIMEFGERKISVTLSLCCSKARQLKGLENEEVWRRVEVLRVGKQK